MPSALLLLITMVLLVSGYVFYGRKLKRVFGIEESRLTPAYTERDGVDYEPARNWLVLFGHHFSSISGAGPIVGPVVACAYWGWGPSVLWLLIGAIAMGGVADFASLFVSVRSKGSSMAFIAKPEISSKARLFFIIFSWLALVLIIAVFAIFSAKTFVKEPANVVPSLGLIPLAIFFGWLLYRKNLPNRTATPLALLLLAALLFFGTKVPLSIPPLGGLDPESIWVLLLLVYCYAASVVPVQTLLQPRVYLAGFILFFIMGFGIVSVFVSNPVMDARAFAAFNSGEWPGAGPLFPMLFVTIACGAISGFHAMVSSGTSCKQIASESHVCRIGYGGMLLECLLGVLVLICVAAALSYRELDGFLRTGGPIDAFSEGFGRLSAFALGGYGKAFAVLAMNAFILTTLDTATRITRYLTQELFGISNKHLATGFVIAVSAFMAFSGHWAVLWPAFGTSNQMIAGISLLVASCWLLNRGKGMMITLVPAVLMLIITLTAFGYQIVGSMRRESPDYLMAGLSLGLAVMAVLIGVEAFRAINGALRKKSVT
jgi:carbon starvation protein